MKLNAATRNRTEGPKGHWSQASCNTTMRWRLKIIEYFNNLKFVLLFFYDYIFNKTFVYPNSF